MEFSFWLLPPYFKNVVFLGTFALNLFAKTTKILKVAGSIIVFRARAERYTANTGFPGTYSLCLCVPIFLAYKYNRSTKVILSP